MNVDLTKYKVVNGTFYNAGTPDDLIQVLERARESRVRLAVAYRSESRPEFGRVGRSMGPVKIPLLVHNSRALGGEGLCTSIIVEIRESAGGKVLYRAES
jgi:hypothetical protein